VADPFLAILQLSDSLFPLGGFAYSDGLEAAITRSVVGPAKAGHEGNNYPTTIAPSSVVSGFTRPPVRGAALSAQEQAAANFLCDWMDAVLNETIGRTDGPIVWSAWHAFRDERWDVVASLDEEATALRPSSAARRASRAMGMRLLTTWAGLHPDARLDYAVGLARSHDIGPALPVAFAGTCACAQVERRRAVEAYGYSRLAATISAAMRLLPIGHTQAHGLLARALDALPAVVDAIERRDASPESFAPVLDIECMSQQYLHSRLFRS
jgi:urease accessory protein